MNILTKIGRPQPVLHDFTAELSVTAVLQHDDYDPALNLVAYTIATPAGQIVVSENDPLWSVLSSQFKDGPQSDIEHDHRMEVVL